ncbi:Os08g0458050 [Oryza sativa Japonica Group]|uniref:Os08g0458050 protein n=1 Tax=Oryza sativa subsp. japonica TaxID=39947 RepID=A0A0P0XGQ4_ORYSJ|nr:Os08g0458050 [Oryza sativa Japonica Group]
MLTWNGAAEAAAMASAALVVSKLASKKRDALRRHRVGVVAALRRRRGVQPPRPPLSSGSPDRKSGERWAAVSGVRRAVAGGRRRKRFSRFSSCNSAMQVGPGHLASLHGGQRTVAGVDRRLGGQRRASALRLGGLQLATNGGGWPATSGGAAIGVRRAAVSGGSVLLDFLFGGGGRVGRRLPPPPRLRFRSAPLRSHAASAGRILPSALSAAERSSAAASSRPPLCQLPPRRILFDGEPDEANGREAGEEIRPTTR